MSKQETYDKLIRRLKEKEPDFREKAMIKQQILDQLENIYETKRGLTRTLQNWTETKWLRWSLSTAAAILLTLFLSQQIMISYRLKNLEKQFVKTDVTPESNESAASSSHRFVFKLISDKQIDSITVSKKDLDALLEEYLDMKEEIEKLKDNETASGSTR